MPDDGEVGQASDDQRGAYDSARQRAEAAQEAVGDAEDALAAAERARDARLVEDGPAEQAEHELRVSEAERAWHERRHDAHAASQALDHARGEHELGGDEPERA